MEEFIQSLSQRLGLPETVVRQSASVLLGLIKEHTQGTTYEKFVTMIPGADSLANAPSPTGENAGGLLGGLLSAAGGMLGGQTADLAKAAAALKESGLETSQIPTFITGFIDEAREMAGPETVARILESFPALGTFLGEKSK